MRNFTRSALAAIALTASAGAALAQTTIVREELTPNQRTVIYRTITKERVVTRPAPQVQLRVGARVPQSVELQSLPETVVTEVPSVKRYRYMVINNEVLLVDPDTSEVVEVIGE